MEIHVEENPNKPIMQSWGADAGLTSAFANAVRNHPDQLGNNENSGGSLEYRFYAKESYHMDIDAKNGVEATILLIGKEKIEIEDYVQLVIDSVLDGRSEDMRFLLYAEEDLRNRLGLEKGDFSQAIYDAIDNLQGPEKSMKVMKYVIGGLREHIWYRLPFKGERIKVRFQDFPVEENKSKDQINFSEKGYIVFPENGVSDRIGDVDVVETQNTLVFCTPSEETVKVKGDNEDSATVVDLNDGTLLVEADGVGQSYLAYLGSRFAVKDIFQQGTSDLEGNLKKVSSDIQKYHNEMPELDTTELWEVVVNVLKERKEKVGSQTTFNQIFIEKKTGEVKGLFCGDGGFAILKRGKDLEKHSLQGESKYGPDGVLSTKFGAVGNLRRIEDLIDQKIFLNPRDIVFLFSDGVTNNVLDKCVKVINSEPKDIQKTKIAEILDDNAQDDRTLLIYKHS